MSNFSVTNRYTDEELAIFKEHIENKLAIAIKQKNASLESIENIAEANREDGDWMDDTSNSQDLEMKYMMLNRQKKHIQDLEYALIRIKNKSYGICIVSGQLIDKRRLMAVPTTTKSLEAKKAISEEKLNPPMDQDEEGKKRQLNTSPKEKVIFSKIIKKSTNNPSDTDSNALAKNDREELLEDDHDLDFDWGEFMDSSEEQV